MHHSKFVIVAALLFGGWALYFTPSASAQTNWGIEGTVPAYGEFNTPPPACGAGTPPYITYPSPAPTPGCPPMTPFPPQNCQVGGGSAVDNDGNAFSGGAAFPAFLHTDGFTIEMTDYVGTYILSMAIPTGAILPGILTGLAMDSLTDTVWITDGVFCAAVGLVSCGVPPIIVPAFPLPGGPSVSGLGWDPCTGTLWFCDCGGRVANCDTSGGFITGFSGSPPLGLPLTGLSVNVTNGNIVITDGLAYAELTPTGALAPTGPFYLDANPAGVPVWGGGIAIDGLGFSLRPQRYGTACGATPPSIGWTGGYPFAGNFGFTVTQTGATPGLSANLCLSFFRSCPALPFGGCPPGSGFWLMPPFIGCFGAGVVPGTGSVSFPLPLPPAGGCTLPVGLPIYAQFVNFGGGVVEASDALSFTIGEL